VTTPILPRDQAFFLFLSNYEMKKCREHIINQRDKTLADPTSCRTTFILCMDHSTIPPRAATFSPSAFRRSLGPTVRFYKPSKNDVLSMGVPDVALSSTTAVALRVAVPYGAKQIILSFRSDTASSLFGWHQSSLIRAEPVETGANEQSKGGTA
jgi:hypothetical protein